MYAPVILAFHNRRWAAETGELPKYCGPVSLVCATANTKRHPFSIKGGDSKVPFDSCIHAMHSCTLTQTNTHRHTAKHAHVNRKARL